MEVGASDDGGGRVWLRWSLAFVPRAGARIMRAGAMGPGWVQQSMSNLHVRTSKIRPAILHVALISPIMPIVGYNVDSRPVQHTSLLASKLFAYVNKLPTLRTGCSPGTRCLPQLRRGGAQKRKRYPLPALLSQRPILSHHLP